MLASRQDASRNRIFLDIPTAAELAGFSSRHFRRIIEQQRIEVFQIGRRFYIRSRDFDRWIQEYNPKRLSARQAS